MVFIRLVIRFLQSLLQNFNFLNTIWRHGINFFLKNLSNLCGHIETDLSFLKFCVTNFVFQRFFFRSQVLHCNIPLKCKIDLLEKCGDIFIEDSLEGMNFICVELVK